MREHRGSLKMECRVRLELLLSAQSQRRPAARSRLRGERRSRGATEHHDRQAEPRIQKCSEQQTNRLNQAHKEVSQGCRETAILLAKELGIDSCNSLLWYNYGVFGSDSVEIPRFSPGRCLRRSRRHRVEFMAGSESKAWSGITLVELLQRRAATAGDRRAFTLLVDGETVERNLTYDELDRQARAVATALTKAAARGERVLLALPDALEFLTTFFGTLYAGAIAVPVKLPTNAKHLESTLDIARDCEAKFVVGSGVVFEKMRRLWTTDPAAPTVAWIDFATIDFPVDDAFAPPSNAESIAYLQYTSGSTRAARGVMVSHRNLVCNLQRVQQSVRQTRESCSVQWLPLYHDMGLTSLLFALYVGFPAVVLSPAQFLQRPLRWLQAITRYKATLSGGPNFAYQLCADRIRTEDRATLDLSTWQTAYCGAEPVRAVTYGDFLAVFEPHGFGRTTFAPCYGLAEYVAAATAQQFGDSPHFLAIDAAALRVRRIEFREASVGDNDAATVVIADCGVAGPDDELLIVDPDTRRPCADRMLGEIWITGPSLTRGYWNRPEENRESFAAVLDDDRGPFLRTGDLGFLLEGRLFVTGRMKDLIIIRGQNYYPQDIESTVEQSHAAVAGGAGAAFSIEVGRHERLVLVQELAPRQECDPLEVIFAVRAAVAEKHEAQLDAVVLLKPNRLPKTSSGKTQRQACKLGFLDDALDDVVARWQSGEQPAAPGSHGTEAEIAANGHAPSAASETKSDTPSHAVHRTADEITAWLVNHLAQRMNVPARDFDVRRPFAQLGLDSVHMVSLVSDLEPWLGQSLSPTLAWDYPTVESLAHYLAGDPADQGCTVAASAPAEPIAIVGMGCRFPGAPNLDSYWSMIAAAGEGVIEIPADRWNVDAFHDADYDAPGKMVTRRCGMLAEIDQFDAGFFGITPREASRMDPQQRLLLEVSSNALEHAGIAADRAAGSRTGVFVGIGGSDYSQMYRGYEDYLQYIDAYCGTGNALSIAANRISYLFDFRGPSLSIDTACSSALVALHYAVQSLRQRDCDMALAGGVNVILSPETTIAFSKARMLSPDGRCRPFDAGANGYVRGEGCGVVVLKRLNDAVRDGDRVLAVIRGTAVNQDGRTSGMTAPNGPSQQLCIRTALAQAGVVPDDLTYFEAHGTGTPLGDPIEFSALQGVVAGRDSARPPIYVGSVKANIGHTETASGVAALIKVVLMFEHGVIPPQPNFETLNPNIPHGGSPLHVPCETVAWRDVPGRRIAGVSGFGFGGTNAHVIVEEARPPAVEMPLPLERPQHTAVVSAPNEEGLRAAARQLAEHFAARPTLDVADVCYTLNTGRSHYGGERAAFVVETTVDLATQLQRLAAGESIVGARGTARRGVRPKVAFLFTGQGSQYIGMGRQLFETQPTFRRILQTCDEILRPKLDASLCEVLYGEAAQAERVHQTAFTQPALFAVEYALAELWRSWGVQPTAVLGHSVGEYAAACIAGAISLEDGLRLIAERARLMQSLPQTGGMAALFVDERAARRLLEPFGGQLSIAAVNGPSNTVVSGDLSAIDELLARCTANGVGAQRLVVSHAFHSAHLDPILNSLAQYADGIVTQTPRLSIVSNLTGRPLGANERLDGSYWRAHSHEAVRFAEGMQSLDELGCDVFLEVGPTPILLAMGKRCLAERADSPTKHAAAWLPSLKRGQPDWPTLLGSLAQLHTLGGEVSWRGFDRDYRRKRLSLPTYPFQRQRYWLEPQKTIGSGSVVVRSGGRDEHPLLGTRLPSAAAQRQFVSTLNLRKLDYLKDHRVQGSIVFPGAGYVEMAFAAACAAFGKGSHSVEKIDFQHVLFLETAQPVVLNLLLSPEIDGLAAFQIFQLTSPADAPQETWSQLAAGTVSRESAARELPPEAATDEAQSRESLQAIASGLAEHLQHDECYAQLHERRLDYGPLFRGVHEIWKQPGEAVALLHVPAGVVGSLLAYHMHPAVLDAMFHTLGATIPESWAPIGSGESYLPIGVDKVRVCGTITETLWAHSRIELNDEQRDLVSGDILLYDAAGRLVAEVRELHMRRVGRRESAAAADVASWFYRTTWRETSSLSLPPVEARNGSGHAGDDSIATRAPWLFVGDVPPQLQALPGLLESRGERVIVVPSARLAESNIALDSFLNEQFPDSRPTCAGVVYWAGCEIRTPLASTTDDVAEQTRWTCEYVVRTAQEIARRNWRKSPRLLLVGRGAVEVDAAATEVEPAQSMLWGLGRVMAVEMPELSVTLVDLDPHAEPSTMVEPLAAELLTAGEENQIALRGSQRWLPRLVTGSAEAGDGDESTGRRRKCSLPHGNTFRLEFSTPGNLDRLQLRPFRRKRPGVREVEIEVGAAGLNFSDVLKALGRYPGLKPGVVPMGIECAGRVTAVGRKVTGLEVGQSVLAIAPFSFASHAVTRANGVLPKPTHLSDAEAATIPITFLTAHYALREIARIRPGERVLIHAAAGGVGLAAIQICQAVGAEMFCTAGSEEKRDFLRSLGVQHVYDSRSLAFAEQIQATTNREGVDVVLNSLPGEAIPRSFELLRSYGRFLEIGKTDIYQNRMLGMFPFQKNLLFAAIDLDRMLRERPKYMRRMFLKLAADFQAHRYRPLPHTSFAIEEVIGAYRYMQQRKNIGKVVVTMPVAQTRTASSGVDANGIAHATSAIGESKAIVGDGAYLITGGLGGLGLQLTRWLVGRGARCLWLMGRSEPSSEANAVLDELRAAGADIRVLRADVADADQLTRALSEAGADGTLLRGVFHAAGVLDDAALLQLDRTRIDRVLAPKVRGAWNLHRATADRPLDHFVLFSSIAALFGSPGQGNYAAANAFLDGLAASRRRQGLPALSINWGPWAEVGMAARNADGARMAEGGIRPISLQGGLAACEQLLESDATQVAVVDVEWTKLAAMFTGGVPGLLRELATAAPKISSEARLRQEIIVAPREQRIPLLLQAFVGQLARVMEMEPEKIDVEQPLTALGLDSLMVIELKNVIEMSLGISIPMARFMEGPSVRRLAEYALEAVDGGGASENVGSSVDFESESRLAADVQPSSATPPTPGPFQNVLLTGATGFVGAFLLQDLLKQTNSNIHCLVRAESPATGRERLRDNLAKYRLSDCDFGERVKVVVGDLTQERCGLSAEAFTELARATDAVIHNAANVNLSLPYERLCEANVTSTRELLRLACCERVKPFHFVSTYGVFTSPRTVKTEVIRETDEPPPCATLLGGYVQTKWVSERLVREAARRGLPTAVYRLGRITGDTSAGATNMDDFLHTVMRAGLQMRAVPDLDAPFDMTPVDFVSRAIVALALGDNYAGKSFHLLNPEPVRLTAMTGWLKGGGFEVETVPYAEWRRRLSALAKASRDPLMQSLRMVIDQEGGAEMDGMSIDEIFLNQPKFDTTNVEAGLRAAGLSYPKIDAKLLEMYFADLLAASINATV